MWAGRTRSGRSRARRDPRGGGRARSRSPRAPWRRERARISWREPEGRGCRRLEPRRAQPRVRRWERTRVRRGHRPARSGPSAGSRRAGSRSPHRGSVSRLRGSHRSRLPRLTHRVGGDTHATVGRAPTRAHRSKRGACTRCAIPTRTMTPSRRNTPGRGSTVVYDISILPRETQASWFV